MEARDRSGEVPVTVPGLNPDAEGSLIGEQQWQAIHARRAAGQNVSAIAREFDLDRKTVRSCLREQSWRPYRREVVGPTLLDEHRQWLLQRAAQVNYSARILYQELVAQRDWGGSYETVKLAVPSVTCQLPSGARSSVVPSVP